ncbi:MAG: sodium/proton-translocating pyrophosphatase, partial [Ginsengibacter sp.]
MMLPGAIALLSPVIIGFVFGPEVLGGFLAGATVSGVLMGIFQNNAGGAWDNAKKSFEKGAVINNETHYKGSEPHKASVTGDTVGDPFKDTSGPSMNILIKLMSIVSLVIAPTLAHNFASKINTERQEKINTLVMMNRNEAVNTNKNQWFLDPASKEKEVKEFIDVLAADKVIRANTFSVAVKNGSLFIDGNPQTKAISEKYQNYIDKTGDFVTREANH